MQAKTALLICVLALLAISAAAETAEAAPRKGGAMRPARGRRFGDFLKQRLRWKLKEYGRDLKAAQREVDLVKVLNNEVCGTIPRGPNTRRLARARAAVRFWKSVVAARKSVVAFHGKRHGRYTKLHRYASKGPKARRAYIRSCIKAGKKGCGRAWCKKNKKNRRACSRWRESRKYYRAARDKRVILKKHSRVARKHRYRLRRALGAYKRAVRRLAKAKRTGKKNRRLRRCRYRSTRRLRRFARAVNRIRAKIGKLKKGFGKIKAKIAKREKKYKKFSFRRCRKVPRGRHHAFTCRKGKNKKLRKTFKFRRCRALKRFSKKLKKHFRVHRCHK